MITKNYSLLMDDNNQYQIRMSYNPADDFKEINIAHNTQTESTSYQYTNYEYGDKVEFILPTDAYTLGFVNDIAIILMKLPAHLFVSPSYVKSLIADIVVDRDMYV